MSDLYSQNRKVYESQKIVQSYALSSGLQLAEESIVQLISKQLSTMTMLDIGVGAGRTTRFFAPRVDEYFAIDCSKPMITECQRRCAHLNIPNHFQVMDVRKMPGLTNHSFDFVLFSYNGIDYISHNDRRDALKEIYRVGKPQGYFCFSSHNLFHIRQYQKFSFSRNPWRSWQNWKRAKAAKMLSQKLNNLAYTIFGDGGEDYQVQTYYIHPLFQKKELMEIGYSSIRIFSEQSGLEITDDKVLENSDSDRWYYYLCQFGS